MTQDTRSPQAPADPSPSAARPIAGLTVGIGLLALVAVPAYFTGLFALAGFTGCFIGCSEPDPLIGILWAGITVILLATPVLAGLVTARARRRGHWLLAALAAAALVTAWTLAQSVL